MVAVGEMFDFIGIGYVPYSICDRSVGAPRETSRRIRHQSDPMARLLLLGERRLRLARLRDYLKSSLWFLPALAFSAAGLLSVATTILDQHLRPQMSLPLGLVLDAESARGLLSLISTWVLTFIGLAFTMTIVVLQLASGQFSPRVVGTLLRDRFSQTSMGMFIGTFAYAFIVLRLVGTGSREFVPAISIGVAFSLMLISLGVFIRYVNHVAQSIRAGSVIATVARETRRVIDQQIPDRDSPVNPQGWRPYHAIPAPRAGLLRSYDDEALVALASRCDVVIELVPKVGGFVPKGAPLARVLGNSTPLDDSDVLSQISIGEERTMHQDPMFGFRQLVDIAERALSPGVNDPTTAVQVIDQIHDLLRDAMFRHFPSGTHPDGRGVVRLVVPVVSWVDLLRMGVEEIRHYGADSIQVSRRLRVMLQDLISVAPAPYRPALESELSVLHEVARVHFPDLNGSSVTAPSAQDTA